MAGKLYVSEYNNLGDISPSVPQEPSTVVQEVAFGGISEPLHENTRLIALFADMPCKVCFVAKNEDAREEDATPMAEEYEITRLVHMSSGIRVAVYARD